MEKKIEYEWIAPEDFLRHPAHEKMLLGPEEKNQAGYIETVEKYGKLRPVLYVLIGGKKYLIDGLGYVSYAIEKSISLVLAQEVYATTEEEIVQVIAEANSTYHTSAQSLYKMAETLYCIHSQGKGYRSDLEDTGEEDKAAESDYNEEGIDATETPAPAKKLTIYEKIGQMLGGLPGTRIKHLLFVGRFNPLYLERMDCDRMSLYAAYMHCKSEQRGDMPDMPAVKEPTYVSDDTGIPQFSESAFTQDTVPMEEVSIKEDLTNSETLDSDVHKMKDVESTVDKGENKPEYIIVKGICTKCGEETEVKVNINQLNKNQ